MIISGLGFMPDAKEDINVEAKLLYVAMTRSTDKLLLMYHQGNLYPMSKRLNAVRLTLKHRTAALTI